MEGYLIMQVEVACALEVAVHLPAEVREAICGTVGKIIKGVAKVGGEMVDLAKRLIERPLAIPSTLWNETQSLRERMDGKKTGCEGAPCLLRPQLCGLLSPRHFSQDGGAERAPAT